MDDLCIGCPLHGEGMQRLDPIGPVDAPYVIITDMPSLANAATGRLISRSAMALLSKTLSAQHFDKGDFRFIPQISCSFDPDLYPTKVRRQIAKYCRYHMLEAIAQGKPEALIPLGAEASRQVLGRAVKISKVRGLPTWSNEHQCHVFPLLNPGYVAMYPQHVATFESDIQMFRKSIDNDYDAEAAGKQLLGGYQFIDDLQFLIDKAPPVLAFDIESTGISWFQKGGDVRSWYTLGKPADFQPRAQILTMQFCIAPGEAYMLVWDHPENPRSLRSKARIVQQLEELLCNPDTCVIGQNLKYDNVYVTTQLGFRFRIGGDTLMLAALVDENAMTKGQDDLVKRYVPQMAGYADHFNATYDKGKMWEIPLEQMLDYGCGDVESCFLLYEVLYDKVSADKKLLAHYEHVSLPGLNALASLEMRGMYIDESELGAFKAHMIELVETQKNALMAQVHRDIRKLHIDFIAKGKTFSRGDFIRDILFRHPKGFRLVPRVFTKTTAKLQPEFQVESTSTKDHLPYFYDTCPFTMELSEYIKNERLLNTSVVSFEKKYIVDAKVRPSYSLSRTVTGRTSCVKGDTPIITGRGVVPADRIVVGDEVFTHKLRWRRITTLYQKDPTDMYHLYLGNGEVLTVTLYHRVMLDSGIWADVGYILEGMGYALSQQEAHERSASSAPGSYDVQEGASDCSRGGEQAWSQPCNGEGNDPCIYTGRYIQYAEGDEVSSIQAGGKEPAVREPMGFRLRRWPRIPYTPSGREEVLCTPHSHGGVFGDAPRAATGHCEHPSHRREHEEQRHTQFMPSYGEGTPANTRQVPVAGGGLTIEKVVCAGVHRVYDFEVEEDHSYLACGVFNHNSENPNGQNYPKRGPSAKAYRKMFNAPPGYYCLEADLSQAELRIAADMANDRTMLNIYKDPDGDIHTATALIVMGVTLEQFRLLPKKDQKDARTKAKACIAEGQLVLTHLGLVPIENVTTVHKVWDGVEWVHHEGVVYKGYREVITYEGLTATPDHQVYTEGHSDTVPFGSFASSVPNRRIAIGGVGGSPVRYDNSDRKGSNSREEEREACRGRMFCMQEDIPTVPLEYTVGENHKLSMPKNEEIRQRPESFSIGGKVRCDKTEMQGYGYPYAKELRGERDKEPIQKSGALYKVPVVGATAPHLFRYGYRQGRQQRALRAGEPTYSPSYREPSKYAEKPYGTLPWAGCVYNALMALDSIRHRLFSFLSGLHDKTSPPSRGRGRCFSSSENEYQKSEKDIRGGYESSAVIQTVKEGKTFAHVYDIVNAGPLHRFTVSGKVVHNCNFGFLYGMGWRKFIGYAKTQYGVEFSEKEAQRIRAGFFSTYYNLPEWHESMRAFAKEHKYVRSYDGRIRHLPMIDSQDEGVQGEASRQSINSPVQEFGSSLGVMAMGRMNDELDDEYLELVGFVHDAIYCYVRHEHLEWGIKTLKRYMESSPLREWFGLRMKVPMIADVSFGLHLGDMIEVGKVDMNAPIDFSKYWDEEKQEGIVVTAKQETPPNNGLREYSLYGWC